jgi:hypothetical protein
MKVGLNGHFLIQGCEIINYLLEKSRVVTQSTMEVTRLACDTCVMYAAAVEFWYKRNLWALTCKLDVCAHLLFPSEFVVYVSCGA